MACGLPKNSVAKLLLCIFLIGECEKGIICINSYVGSLEHVAYGGKAAGK